MDTDKVLTSTVVCGVPLLKKGKVRDVYDLGDRLLIAATDRISAFDCILPCGIPHKGEVLTGLSVFWFDYIKDIIETHFISGDVSSFSGDLSGRAMIVKKADPLPVECVVRGYLAGSGWKEYKASRSVCGMPLESGYKESDKLPEPLFTPARKSDAGHDENIDYAECINILGKDTAEKVRRISIALYKRAHNYAGERGIIIADTKFEFGMLNGRIILIDEAFTPDSSRFWPKEGYCPGMSQPSFDKQFVRDYLESTGWNKQPPAPNLPREIIDKTSRKYLDAYRYITGRELCRR